ncbi:MAG: D-aminoacyl-tRNA deacylase [Candidatus Thermoplasmatota archaeon]
MRLIVSSKQDKASQNILSSLLERGWNEVANFRENPVYKKENGTTDLIVTVEEHHIYCDGLDKEVEKSLDVNIEEIVFISRHSSEAGVNSLTVHPIGNYGEAKFGGKEGKLVPCSPHKMTLALLELMDKAEERDIHQDYDVSFEATHHGPYLETPTYYIEIGSDESSWTDKRAGDVIADTVMSEKVKGEVESKHPVVACIGGGHYAPRFTQLAQNRKVSIGHMVPGWGMKYLKEKSFGELVKKTPGVEYVYFDRSSTSGKERKRAKAWAEDHGLEAVRSDRFERR